MAIQNFATDESTRKEVFDFIEKQAELYALSQIRQGKDVSGVKNALEILSMAQQALIKEYTHTQIQSKPDRAV